MYPVEHTLNFRKINIFVIVADFVTVVILLALFIIKLTKTATLDIQVAPNDAIITISGKQYINGTYKIQPGRYTATISHPDFDIKTVELNLEANRTAKLYSYLANNNNFSSYLTNDINRNILSNIPDESAQAAVQNYDLSKKLPYKYETYSSDYSSHTLFTINQDKSKNCDYFCLIIDDITGNNYDLALRELQKLGFDTERCDIKYNYDDAKNPLLTGYGHEEE